jgi:hypothetical protein
MGFLALGRDDQGLDLLRFVESGGYSGIPLAETAGRNEKPAPKLPRQH